VTNVGIRQKPKRPSKLSDKAQSERFIEAARKLGIEETGETFDRAFKKVVPPKRITPSSE
jgi:hypothetical protein